MAEIRFPLEVFGLTGVQAQPYEFADQPETPVDFDKPVGTREKPSRSLLGAHIIDNLRFEAGQYTDPEGNAVSYGAITLETVLMRVTQRKEIVMEKVAGRVGTVKEYISQGDYDVQIYGSLQRPDNVFPEEELERLVEILNAPASIEVISPFLQRFGINLLVITQFEFNQKPGYENQQPFSISAISDRDIELVIDDESA